MSGKGSAPTASTDRFNKTVALPGSAALSLTGNL